MPVEGMVRVETMDDYYDYEPDRQELRGMASGKSFRLGQVVEVKLMEVNPGRLEINLALAGMEEEVSRKGRQNRVAKSAGKSASQKAKPRRAEKAVPTKRENGEPGRRSRASKRYGSSARRGWTQ
jgi:ribonuclease R